MIAVIGLKLLLLLKLPVPVPMPVPEEPLRLLLVVARAERAEITCDKTDLLGFSFAELEEEDDVEDDPVAY